MPGEFSLMKAVLELKKQNLLADDCIVEFLTMNKHDERYVSSNENKLTAEKYLEISSKAFLSVIENQKSEEDFNSEWNKTDVSKIPLCMKGNASANCDFILNDINQLIKSYGLASIKGNNNSESVTYHRLRLLWVNMLSEIRNNCSNDGIISGTKFIEIISEKLTEIKKAPHFEQFQQDLVKIINYIQHTKHTDRFFTKDRIMHDLTSYNLQLKLAQN